MVVVVDEVQSKNMDQHQFLELVIDENLCFHRMSAILHFHDDTVVRCQSKCEIDGDGMMCCVTICGKSSICFPLIKGT